MSTSETKAAACERCGKKSPAEIHTCSPSLPWDEMTDDQKVSFLATYANVKESVQTVTEVKDVRHMKGTGGWWIKTDVMRDWTSIGWFKIIPSKQ